MKPIFFILAVLFSFNVHLNAQTENTKVILITLDGLRWQELFTGADSLLISNTDFVNDTTALKDKFWRDSSLERRQVLFPFLWSHVAEKGQLHGNRNLDSRVDLTNTMWFSYPGYNEILTGKADDTRITSNDKFPNPNKTILEIANKDLRYAGKVAAFGSWDVFPYIVNETRSGVPVNAGFKLADGDDLTEREKFLNQLQPKVPSPWGTVRLDAFTHYYAVEHIRKTHPELIYVAYGETDDFAHDGEYDAYLNAAQNTDSLIKELWELTQSDPFYKDNTLFLITTDHGRGTQPLDTWKGHGSSVNGAGQVWLIAFGKGVSAEGEVAKNEQLYSNQIAPTISTILGLNDETTKMEGKLVPLKTN
ncbi:sulfatase-like hydrolase/transferase [Maribacter antarcticus]|uniref:sulfatase-like hydrolase/transferase n=1 Tax=Maribacter antarcticus TaxID=505250 RepID=UPI00047B2610|nr:sulfatase-like hydrolase/transferase [Maribacter antarcticus]